MKKLTYLLLVLLTASLAFAQRDYRNHTRSMLRQTVYNTGELGRALEGSNSTSVGLPLGTSSLEWPPFSRMTLDQIPYWGQQNGQGSGLVLRALVRGTYEARACGGITDGSGNAIAVAGVFVIPGSIVRTENYPVLADGSLNPNFNPDEAEEKIVTQYETTPPMKLRVTQTSRAWSFPGYDSFIITEYDIVNFDTLEYTNGFVMSQNAFSPSAFGLQRKYGIWNESSVTSRSREEYCRYNFSRLMTYVHSRNGFPDTVYFDRWSSPGNRGGLNSPQAVGVLPLHYDYDRLQPRSQTTYTVSDSARVWDENGKFKQPYSTETNGNRNQEMSRTILLGLDINTHNPNGFNNKQTGSTASADSSNWALFHSPYKAAYPWAPGLTDPIANQSFIDYWHGRMKPRAFSGSGYTGAFFHYMSFGPYVFRPGEHLKFAIAHVVGYGPGVAVDSVWRDAGGRNAGHGVNNGSWFSPVPSWYNTVTYPNLSGIAGITTMGSTYLQNHSLPWYVTGGNGVSSVDPARVISIRDVADRAIQMYTGKALKKYDGVQFRPESTAATGAYNTSYIPIPSPHLIVKNGRDTKNRLVWSPAVEAFTSLPNVQAARLAGRIRASLSHYLVLKSPEGLGPWTVLDTIRLRDPRYYDVDSTYGGPQMYVYRDGASLVGENYYYALISVDSLGGRSGFTNITYQITDKAAVLKLGGKLYVAPNPLILTSNYGGSTLEGDINDRIKFFGLPQRARIRVFSYSGQLVGEVMHDADLYSHEWFQISRNSQRIAAGVYFYVVEDLNDGSIAKGKFVVIH
ncbi:MAG: T9SS C-terminal target domain-containing protein [Ignavibacteriae bacterium]|nr:T9SS C-terminal target domain-containing protein [Ignavibacteriota bacterium]